MANINMCLAVNGGTLADYSDASTRDDSFVAPTPTYYCSYNWGGPQDPTPPKIGDKTVTYPITFPSKSIASVSVGYWGGNNEGNTNATGIVQLYVDSVWTTVGGSTSYSGKLNTYTGELTDSTGWSNVTGIRSVVAVTGTVGLQRIAVVELQAWAPGGTSYGAIIG